MKRFLTGFLSIACHGFLAAEILPAPQAVTDMSGMISLPDTLRADDRFVAQASALADALASITGRTIPINGSAGTRLSICLAVANGGTPESYELEIGDVCELRASTTAGMAHAASTLLQLLEKDKGGTWSLPRVRISDAPDFSFRGFMVDMGRNPHSPEVLRRVVDMMWLCKANYLHLHLTDDQLWSWPSTAFPKLLSPSAGWTRDEWRALEVYSQARGVTIIPELEVPGHSGRMRQVYPKVFGKTPAELASSDKAFEGITTLLLEMMDVFRATPFIHVGGDEAMGVDEKLQRDLVNRLNRFIKSHGRRTIVWEGPRLGMGDNRVDADVIHMPWRSIEFPASEMVRAGHEIINASWDPLYVVDHYPRTMFTAIPADECYRLDLRRFKNVDPGLRTYASPHRLENLDGVLGFCMPWWEGREKNLVPMCRQLLNAAAARAWNDGGEKSFDSFLVRDARLAAMLDTLRPWHGGPPTGGWPQRMESPAEGNLAHGKTVRVSHGAQQPLFHPQRLTNGATDRFDHFLGYPTEPEPLEITIDLGTVAEVGRIVVYEAAVGGSWEKYELGVSDDGGRFVSVGSTQKDSRAGNDHVSFTFSPKQARFVRITTSGCKNLTFPSFSRLCEVMVFKE